MLIDHYGVLSAAKKVLTLKRHRTRQEPFSTIHKIYHNKLKSNQTYLGFCLKEVHLIQSRSNFTSIRWHFQRQRQQLYPPHPAHTTPKRRWHSPEHPQQCWYLINKSAKNNVNERKKNNMKKMKFTVGGIVAINDTSRTGRNKIIVGARKSRICQCHGIHHKHRIPQDCMEQ